MLTFFCILICLGFIIFQKSMLNAAKLHLRCVLQSPPFPFKIQTPLYMVYEVKDSNPTWRAINWRHEFWKDKKKGTKELHFPISINYLYSFIQSWIQICNNLQEDELARFFSPVKLTNLRLERKFDQKVEPLNPKNGRCTRKRIKWDTESM